MLKNKKYIVFGANGLIGKSIVDMILSYDAKVIALDINLNQLKLDFSDQMKSGHLLAYEIDINSEDDVWNILNQNKDTSGAVNATYPRNSSYGSKLEYVTLESFNENTSLLLGSSFVFIKSFIKFFNITKKPISLINMSSIYGVVPPHFELYDGTDMTMPVEYAASKSGIIHLTKYAVKYVNNQNFRMNCVSPGGVATGQDERFVERYKQKTTGSGLLNPTEIAETISFLLSDKSLKINGQNLIIDDGFSL